VVAFFEGGANYQVLHCIKVPAQLGTRGDERIAVWRGVGAAYPTMELVLGDGGSERMMLGANKRLHERFADADVFEALGVADGGARKRIAKRLPRIVRRLYERE
jgi:hypothetical protein